MTDANLSEPVNLLEDRSAEPWIELLKDGEQSYYHDKCDNIDKLYSDLKSLAEGGADREFQLFWANLEVLKPALYSRPPAPVVTPRFKNYKPVPRRASEMLERALISSFDSEDLHASMIHLRDDLAINSRGVLWLRYEAKDDYECVRYDHLDRKDFRHGPARKWSEVPWVARREYLTREKGKARFGADSGWLNANFEQRTLDDEKSEGAMREETAPVWELWHREKNAVVWITDGVQDVLDAVEPWLSLEGFYPCPRPAFGTLQRRTLTPVPDFVYYKDQLEEINELTARISSLSEALRMKGFYAAGNEDVSAAIEKAIKDVDNRALFVPVSNFASMGGAALKDAIVWLPVDQVAQVVSGLVALRKQLIEDVYQITGLSDIMRGATDPNETLGAQQLKSQYGSVRVQDRQNELVRLARDATRMAGEIMAENFSPETLLAMSQIDDLPTKEKIENRAAQIRQQVSDQIEQAKQDPRVIAAAQESPEKAQQAILAASQKAEAQVAEIMKTVTLDRVVELLRSEKTRPFVLDIETNSTIAPDETVEKQQRAEFATAIGGFIEKVGPMVAQEPALAPFAAELLKFLAAPYRAGREMESVIEELADQIVSRVNQQRPPPPDQIKTQAEIEQNKAELAFEQQKFAAEIDLERKKLTLQAAEQNKQIVDEISMGEAI